MDTLSLMSWPEMELGESVAGLLVDGVEGTPFVGATFRLVDSRGPVVEVPYLSQFEDTQFASVNGWFSEQEPPTNMILRSHEGTLTMFDISWSGHSEHWGGGRASLGKLRPHEVVFALRDGPLADPLVLDEVHSNVDGLSMWTGAHAIRSTPRTDTNGLVQSVTIEMEGGTHLNWLQGDATVELRSQWTHSPTRDGVATVTTLQDSVTIVSKFDTARPFWDHFVEQRKVANLLVFLFGRPISFRRHQVKHERLGRPAGSGQFGRPLKEFLSRNTFPERATPLPTPEELGRPLLSLETVGADGLARWADQYDSWARFILPSVSAISRRKPFIEDIVLSTSVSLEAAAQLLGVKGGEESTYRRERPTTATWIYRCLHELGVTWPARVSSIKGLARAIANNYNDIKHADRGDLPSHSETFLVSQVNSFIVRGLALGLTRVSGELTDFFQHSLALSNLAELFEAERTSVLEDGSWVVDHDLPGNQ